MGIRLASMESNADLAELRRLINGYQVTQTLHVVAVLQVADHLADGPRSAGELALATGTNEAALYRLLRAVSAVGVLEELPERRFRLTNLGHGLRSDVPESMAGWAAFVGRPYHFASWARLLEGVREGRNPFELEFGTDIWSYRRDHPEEAAIFNRAMNSLTGTMTESLVSGFDFARFHKIVDVGAGGGAMLAAILQRYPAITGVLFDLPHVVADAKSLVTEAGLGDRIELVAGSFLESLPTGGDAYVLKSVLHNWPDDRAQRILRVCRDAMGASGALLVVERLVPGPNEGMDVKYMDVNMFVGPGSFERDTAEWRALLQTGGFRMERATPVGGFGGFVVIEGTPA